MSPVVVNVLYVSDLQDLEHCSCMTVFAAFMVESMQVYLSSVSQISMLVEMLSMIFAACGIQHGVVIFSHFSFSNQGKLGNSW